jgi:hypothetical protein
MLFQSIVVLGYGVGLKLPTSDKRKLARVQIAYVAFPLLGFLICTSDLL